MIEVKMTRTLKRLAAALLLSTAGVGAGTRSGRAWSGTGA